MRRQHHPATELCRSTYVPQWTPLTAYRAQMMTNTKNNTQIQKHVIGQGKHTPWALTDSQPLPFRSSQQQCNISPHNKKTRNRQHSPTSGGRQNSSSRHSSAPHDLIEDITALLAAFYRPGPLFTRRAAACTCAQNRRQATTL